MVEIGLSTSRNIDVTVISDGFIERFMADANGSFVKVYLYLIYCVQKKKSFSLTSACDFLGDTEKDIMRALIYWEKKGLLRLHRDDKRLTSVLLLSTDEASDREKAKTEEKSPSSDPKSKILFSSPQEEAKNLCKASARDTCEDDLKFVMKIAEKYMERLLNSMDMALICELYEKMNFPADLIIHLYEYCAGNGKTDSKYIEKVALSWADEGIRTVEQAKENSVKYNINYTTVMKSFGIKRLPGTAEQQYINKWVHIFRMPLPLIAEACGRALLQTGRPDFKYADGILKNWNEKNCRDMKAVAEEDKIHAAISGHAGAPQKYGGKVSTRFHSFEQREYSEGEVKELERKLLRS